MSGAILSEYENRQINTPVSKGENSSSRLSPLHVPREVAIINESNDTGMFVFGYPNEEEPENRFREIDDGRSEILLGKFSKKILRLRVHTLSSRLTSTEPLFDPKECHLWCSEISHDRRFACQRNAELIATILAAMPENVRMDLISHFSR